MRNNENSICQLFYIADNSQRSLYIAQLHLCCRIKMIKMSYNKPQAKFHPGPEIIYELNI